MKYCAFSHENRFGKISSLLPLIDKLSKAYCLTNKNANDIMESPSSKG